MAKQEEMREKILTEQAATSKKEHSSGITRRQFINQTVAVSAGVALTGFFPHLKALPLQGGNTCKPILGRPFENPGEITSGPNGVLQAVMRVIAEDRQVNYLDVFTGTSQTPAVCGNFKLRAYEGYRGTSLDKSQIVTKSGVYGPGPTFRARVGDQIQIALLNHIDPKEFPETPDGQCDVVTNSTGTQIYPGVSPKPNPPDAYPDCFRGSNTTNLHFHGTHVSPNAFSDNVLVEIVPDLKAKPEECHALFPIACRDYPNPQAWRHMDTETMQGLNTIVQKNQARLERLDQESPEQNDKTLHTRQAAQNKKLLDYNEFPQFWSGCFPYCIRPPKYNPPQMEMGQSPGTHWYHAHKHGSTSIQVYNGMAGALIIEGDYDMKLRQSMPGVQEKVLVLQQFQNQPNRERTGGASGAGTGKTGAAGALVNGQLMPVITMKPNEVQWWRVINATVQGGKPAFTLSLVGNNGAKAPAFRQIAQDGVQFAWQNYAAQISSPLPNFMAAPGNRADILVQAPSTPGTATLVFGTNTTAPSGVNIILTVNVVAGSGTYNQKWPQTQAEFPQQPSFLSDITSWSESRTIKYEMTGVGSQPTINGKKFEEGIVNEIMLLGTEQEWTIENWSTAGNVRHPFHIHVNPFQIIEVFDPTVSAQPQVLPAPWIWWDTFAIPIAKKDATTGKVTPGYFKMRTRFADFAGKFVDHCHILAHEDRGMMQLVEVIDNKTVVKHH
jgi:FtsP/CotA-like multicopper oxidase with cupredoxin domain